ncbi:MAG: hypothetical protein R3236_09865, partial [Phycisphaeraceae bacterium]|nr:hypothetical protein [Phycisphaeraceae bacterium]
LDRYEAVFVLDDDLVFNGADIDRLFGLLKEKDLWVLQPALHPAGRWSVRFNCARPFVFMRLVNWVENGCLLFRKDILDRFMDQFDPVLVGWGTDRLLMHMLGESGRGKVAIVDAIPCLNPHESFKGGVREIDRLQPLVERKKTWWSFAESRGIREQPRKVYKTIWKKRVDVGDLRLAWVYLWAYARKQFVRKPLKWFEKKWRRWVGTGA